MQTTYFELKILFTVSMNRWQSKQEILAFLASRHASFVEEIVDGIDTPTSAINEDENHRVLPIGVYFPTLAQAQDISAEINKLWPEVECKITAIGGDAWSSAWRENEDNIQTKFFTVFPNARGGSTTTNHRIDLLAGKAFGDGKHATTESCLQSLESIPIQGLNSALDIGTGTGILLIAAGKLGVKSLNGTELSEALVEEARKNLNHNEINARLFVTDHIDEFAAESFDLIMANILVPVLVDLLPDMIRCLKPSGFLLLSGFIDKEVMTITDIISDNLYSVNSIDVRGWKALTFRKKL